jgi:DNA-binding LytR/AlgR family response regulator
VLEALERATRAFVADERYRNDARFVELWVAYADLLPDPAEVFKFLHARRIGEAFLAQLGCTCETLEDGDLVEARLAAPGGPPFDALMLSIVMPRSNGAALCRRLRAAGVDIPIIAVTSYSA